MDMIENFFKEHRIKENVSQKYISNMLDVSPTYINKIESGKGNYNLTRIQSLMKFYDIDLLSVDIDLLKNKRKSSITKVNKYYLEEIILKDTNKNYVIANNLNDLILKIRKRLNLTQVEFSEKCMISTNTISSWECHARELSMVSIFDILKLLNINHFYISRDKVMAFMLNKEIIKKEKENLYKLAKISCKALNSENKMCSYLLGDLSRIDTGNEEFNIYYANDEMEVSYKVISNFEEINLWYFIQDKILGEDAIIDDMYKILKENPLLIRTTWRELCYGGYEYSGRGLYLNYDDGGSGNRRIDVLIEKIENNEIEFWDDMIDESELDMDLVDKVYKCLLKKIY